MGIGLVTPILLAVLQEIQDAGLGKAALGSRVLASAYMLTRCLFSARIGQLSGRFERSIVLLTSLTMSSLDYVLIAVAQSFQRLRLRPVIVRVATVAMTAATAFMTVIPGPEMTAVHFGLVTVAFGPAFGDSRGVYGACAPFSAAAMLAGANSISASSLPGTHRGLPPAPLPAQTTRGAQT
ncbi:hypothetical protein [uncultured Jannaschia sp.]|uniref:hypothetical protein n=1 Tax=uncultured Jannaschia sp. TaxID=293347 RepID=UPI0026223826|nr:hypothetical protein [uncultured Jannaschia sp.]